MSEPGEKIERGEGSGDVTTVVVVDDHAGFRAMARALLADGGFRVIGEATTGAQALALAAGLAPEVMLLDVQLPDIDGFAVSRALRSAGSETRVVLCSVRAAADYGTRVGTCGATGFLTKSELTAAALRAILAES